MRKILALLCLLLAWPAYASTPSVHGHEFVAESERADPPSEELTERLARDSEFVDETGSMGFPKAVATLQRIYDSKEIYWETREEALRTLLLRFERSPGKKARTLQKYLIGKLRTKKEPLEAKKLIYDSIAGQANKAAIPAMVTVASDPAVHEFVRFEACKDLASEKLKPGQKQIVRKALNQIASLKAVKAGEVEGMNVAEVESLLKKF
ncbi:MAG: hypothetical protein AB7K68_08445 [Bacteriovoracia bacterium]